MNSNTYQFYQYLFIIEIRWRESGCCVVIPADKLKYVQRLRQRTTKWRSLGRSAFCETGLLASYACCYGGSNPNADGRLQGYFCEGREGGPEASPINWRDLPAQGTEATFARTYNQLRPR